jgi:RND family efflux transporter MFP subunit
LHISFVGQEVQFGQPLLTVYSPELLVAQRDYLLARQSLPAAESAAAASSRLLLDTARQRLRLWEIGDEEIRALEQSGQPSDELLIRAPVTGHVITKRALAGRAFTAGEALFELGQLSRLWVRAAVVEQDLPAMAVGKKARVIFPQLGDRTLQTTIAFVSPHIDPMTRRGEVRLNLENPDGVLRPEMWARVEIELSRGKVLSVPASAVLDTGSRHVAFVRRDDDHLEPRNVMVGMETADFLEIRAGLEEGEAVVTRALFLIDSESQLRAAIAGMTEEPAAAEP